MSEMLFALCEEEAELPLWVRMHRPDTDFSRILVAPGGSDPLSAEEVPLSTGCSCAVIRAYT